MRDRRDRRVDRSQASLRGALAALVHEKPYGDIAVKQILDRADVGRSTFYAHFGSKDGLLRSCIEQVLHSGRRTRAGGHGDDVLGFSLPLFEHVERERMAARGDMAPRARWEVHEHVQRAVADLVRKELGRTRGSGRTTEQRAPSELVVRWVASTFVLVLNWWVESDSRLSAVEADRVFRSLVEPVLAGQMR